MTHTARLSIRLSPEHREMVRRMATVSKRSQAEVIRLCIEDAWNKQMEWHSGASGIGPTWTTTPRGKAQ